MSPSIVYPEDIDKRLSEYFERDRQKIKEKFDFLFNSKFKLIEDEVGKQLDRDIGDYEDHVELLSLCLHPFLKIQVSNHEVFFIDPLYHLVNVENKFEDLPTFDFIIGRAKSGILDSLIFGEVKGQSSEHNITEDLIKKYNSNVIKSQIIRYISKANPNLKINPRELKCEFVIVTKGFHEPEMVKSIRDKKLPLILWIITEEKRYNQYLFQILERVGDPGAAHDCRSLVGRLHDKKFDTIPMDFFTYSMDVSITSVTAETKVLF